jgi:hypothetical protein
MSDCVRTAKMAASLSRLARSAPLAPGVSRARRLKSTSGRAGCAAVRVQPQDRLAAVHGRQADRDDAVEAAGPLQRGVEVLGPVRRADDDDALGRREAVHLDEQLVQRAVVLVVRAVAAARAAERVELVDEDDAALLARLLEQRADPLRAEADDEAGHLGARQVEERHARLAGDGAGEQRLAGAGRADQQHALRHARAQRRERRRLLQEVDDLAQVLRGALRAGDVGEAVVLAPDRPTRRRRPGRAPAT